MNSHLDRCQYAFLIPPPQVYVATWEGRGLLTEGKRSLMLGLLQNILKKFLSLYPLKGL